MERTVKFAVEDIQMVELHGYAEDEFAIVRVGFLSSCPNSHKLAISNEVLQACAPSVLGKFFVADINPMTGDATTHTPTETIGGYFPKEQTVDFVEEGEYVRAYAYAVVSKIYAADLCAIFDSGDSRAVSVEMKIVTEHDEPMDDTVLEFNIVGVTVLGLGIRPSCPGSDAEMVSFSEEQAKAYFEGAYDVIVTTNFAKERSGTMAEEYVNHPIDTSKEALYDGDWDGDKAKHDLIKEEKYETLAPKVCLRLEDGWEDREVSKLGYPVMCLNDGKWVYSRKGLASALGYAKQHDDNEIVNKVEAIYKKLGLDSDGKEESAKMTEIEFAAVNIGDMWGKLYDAIKAKYPRGEYDSIYWIDSIWEEDNKKFAIIRKHDEDTYWRLDFNYTEEGLTLADEIIKVELEVVETDVIRKFAEPENIDEYRPAKMEEVCPECGKPMSECECSQQTQMTMEEMTARIAELEADIESRDNIIMEKDAELEELRTFRDKRLEEDKAKVVASVLESVAEFMEKNEVEESRTEGMACNFAELDAWSNKVKASIVDKALKKNKKPTEFSRIAGGFESNPSAPMSVWDKIK